MEKTSKSVNLPKSNVPTKIKGIKRKQFARRLNDVLTQCLSFSPSIRSEVHSGRHNLSWAARIAWSWTKEGKILRELYRLVGCSALPNTNLKRRNSHGRVLSPRGNHPTFATVGNLLIVRYPREQVNNCWNSLTTMRHISFEF